MPGYYFGGEGGSAKAGRRECKIPAQINPLFVFDFSSDIFLTKSSHQFVKI